MNVSGILVVALPDEIESVETNLAKLPGIEIHYLDRPSGRIVVTQETDTVAEEVAAFRRLRAVPGVVHADLVEHVVLAELTANVGHTGSS